MIAKLRLFDAIVRAGAARSEDWSERIVAAAVRALVEDLDSPSLRMLAGQPNNDEAGTERLLVAACEELGIPYPPRGERWVPQVIEGRRWERIASDSIRFAIEPSEESVSSMELRILINGVAVSDNLLWGFDPTEIEYFIVNDQGERAHPLSCPACTEPDCDWVFVHRSHDGQTVQWEWACDVPWGMDAGASFPSDEYEAAIEHVRAERSDEREPAIRQNKLGPIASDPKWREWLDTYVFDPRTRDATPREIENLDTRADNAKIIARSIASAAIIALGAGLLIGTVALTNTMHEPPVWSRLLLLTFGFLAVAGLGLSIWREGGRHVRVIEITRARKIEAVASDRTRMLPRTVLSDFYVSDRARDADIWDAAQQMHALNAAWAEYAELSARPNLTLWQEIQLIEAEESARAVTEAIGELLNPGSAVEEPRDI